jgi:hypothetical protein
MSHVDSVNLHKALVKKKIIFAHDTQWILYEEKIKQNAL